MEISALRKLTIQADAPGVRESTDALNKLSAAHKDVAASGAAVASVTDTVTRGQLSAEAAYKKQTLAIDGHARALAQFERAQRVANAALQQGIIDQSGYSDRLVQLRDHYINAANASGGFSKALGISRELLGTFGIALSVGAVVEFGKHLIESTAGLASQARAIGVSTDALQAYRAAAAAYGGTNQEADDAIRRFTRSIGDAADVMGPARKAFMDIGLTAHDLAGGTEAALPHVANALLSIRDASERAREEVALFGRSGQDVERFLKAWADPDVVANMKDAGQVLDEQLIKRADEFVTAWTMAWSKFGNQAVVALGGTIEYIEEHPWLQTLLTGGMSLMFAPQIGSGASGSWPGGMDPKAAAAADALNRGIMDHYQAMTANGYAWQPDPHIAEELNKLLNAYSTAGYGMLQVSKGPLAEAAEKTKEDLDKILTAYTTAGEGMVVVTEGPLAEAARKGEGRTRLHSEQILAGRLRHD
jgi:hypothetical protein